MNNSTAKTSLAREMLRQMDWIVIARKLGEVDHVFVLDRLANGRPHAERKIFEINRLKQRILHARPEPAKIGARPTPPTIELRRTGKKPPRRLGPKHGNGGDRPNRVFVIQLLQLDGISRRVQRLLVQGPVNASGDEKHIQPGSRGPPDVCPHAVPDGEHARLLDRLTSNVLSEHQRPVVDWSVGFARVNDRPAKLL